ncbi:hypothetical protein KC19_5G060700 [Ceratodon purpureus]|uniref:Uncharacterized protein n=1 Tax=Ceratodon purpureus TaxID=3225 RepID=A0A8T0HZU0_CERPU|nr:hypothetical protein KC19_5G060700 [Ceratodon purpureus]
MELLKEFGVCRLAGSLVSSLEMEATRVSSSPFFGSTHIAASAPFPVAFDLAGVASRHVNRVLRASASRARSRVRSGRLESCICRANSSGISENGCGKELPERENREVGVGKNGITMEKVGARDGRVGVVGLNFGSSDGEGFRGSPLPDFEDEFFARMMALEASPLSSSRASSTSTCSYFEGSTLCAGCDPPRPSPGQGVESHGEAYLKPGKGEQQPALGVLVMGGVNLPPSIKKLRRRKNEGNGESRLMRSVRESGCAIKRAFSSMVYMIKAVQSHALQIRQALICDKWDVQQVLHVVEGEMHSSFVWLFQRVFACTPTLMVSVMIFLANFTVFSMGENVAIAAVTETPTPIARILSTYPSNPQVSLPTPSTSLPSSKPMESPMFPLPDFGHGAGGNNIPPTMPTAEGFDGDSRWLNHEANRRHGFSEKEPSKTPSFHPPAEDLGPAQMDNGERHREMMKAWVESTMKNQVQLEQETTQRLVAPVVAHLESDKYACFDRTDLEYQLALTQDPGSAVLLSNFAQFLFIVRHDNDRAEQYFHRAIEADPQDSTILGRFASFLWLGRGNRCAAERVYKAAMAAAPESSYPAGSYAHFLWHAADETEQ